ncbi:hypothetical protein J4N45_11740 [Vibrio sp. SCSIO 43140]|uniref:hypothetical protein n=1 Tax=Vibrio sp. SCSIO 43140 TaxID=2819100 RepID=UPI00207569D9|nr:hypothetical protein [Vibrio sp. SCSIO 43140]USD59200.1 hypothetical protein J4N45_11740 [Vibrio sp. SCSIO 43140]
MSNLIEQCNRELNKVIRHFPEDQRASIDCLLAQLLCCEVFLIQDPILNYFRGKSSPWYHVQNIRRTLLSKGREGSINCYEEPIFQGWSMATIDDARVYEKPIPEKVRKAYLDYQFFLEQYKKGAYN